MSITFDVDDVPPATTGLPLASFASVLTRALEHDLHACHVGTSTMLACAGPEAAVDRSAFANPLVNAVHLAFATHYPLRLTPDAIWTTIAQGFGLHIRLNAEALRGQFVDHQGKKELPVEVLQVPTSEEEWAGLVSNWCSRIREHVGVGAADFFLNTFSTSGSVERTVSEIVMMDAFERYFDYMVMCICGIPYVELTGTVEDWREIRRRVELMVEYGVDDWVDRLRDICDQFVETASGRPDRDFWQCTYKPREVYGGSVSNGWLNRLFPYLETHSGFHSNSAIAGGLSEHDFSSEPWLGARDSSLRTMNDSDRGPARRRWLSAAVAPSSFPNGMSRVAVAMSVQGGQTQQLELLGGLTGIVQDTNTLALQPVLGWAVRTRPSRTRMTQTEEEREREFGELLKLMKSRRTH